LKHRAQPKTRIITGHVMDGLRQLEDESVHCVVTSPPYYGLRSYGTEPQVWGGDQNCSHVFGAEWRGALGLEPTPELYIAHLVEVFREVRRVLRKDGTLWLNIGDSYAGGKQGRGDTGPEDLARLAAAYGTGTGVATGPREFKQRLPPTGTKPKDLLMIAAQLALALRADGWYLRSEIVWAKKAPMPESVTDRPTCAHEKVFLLTKSARYFYDGEAVKEEAEYGENRATFAGGNDRIRQANICSGGATVSDKGMSRPQATTRNMRNVWHLGPEPFPEAHFATFVSEIPRRAILAGTSARGVCPKCGAGWVRETESSYTKHRPSGGKTSRVERGNKVHDGGFGQWGTFGTNLRLHVETIGWRPSCSCDAGDPIPATVLDPFLGAGTTALVADQLGRDCIGIELSRPYAVMAENRVGEDAGMFAQIAAE
jgi:DNA modification methylase